MQNLKWNIEFVSNSKDFTVEEKLTIIQNECAELDYPQTIYSDEDYDEAKYGKWITIFDTWMWVEDAEERNNTSLDPLYLEEWIDVELLCRVRQLHQGIKVPSETELDNYDKLDDCLSINYSGRDKKKHMIMNMPGYETKYHSLPWGWLSYEIVKSNSPYTRKVIWNEEWNFEEIVENDRPDWVVEQEKREQQKVDKLLDDIERRHIRREIKVNRAKYKKLYDAYDKTKCHIYKVRWDKYYKKYKQYSKQMDDIKQCDIDKELTGLTKEADNLLSLFVEMQQACPDDLVDSVLREDVKAKYKAKWYEVAKTYLKRLIRRCEVLNQQKKYEEEEEATA